MAHASGADAEVDGHAFTRLADFELGVGTLSEMQRKIGPATIRETGDAGEYEERLCYLVSTESVSSFLASEVGGPNNLPGFELSSRQLLGCDRWPDGVPVPKLKTASVYPGKR